MKRVIIKHLKTLASKHPWEEKLLFSEHHISHAASAFYPSPFENATILTMDGVGEWATTSMGLGKGSELEILKEIRFPHSLGLMYSAFTYFCGFKVNSGEYKLMGLAPYGEPKYAQSIRDEIIDIKPDGSFKLNLDFFDYCTGDKMVSSNFSELFKGPARLPESEITKREMDLAASVQEVTQDVVVRMAREAVRETGEKNLCLAGGVALNCVANGKLIEKDFIDNIWIQPAAGDAGGALGAALFSYYTLSGSPRVPKYESDSMSGALLGTFYTRQEVEHQLDELDAVYSQPDTDELLKITAAALRDGLAVGWFQGRMEFGPRSLGARSILADPRSPQMQSKLNLKIKFRESFRPFAPSVLEEQASNWFNINTTSPYMLLVSDIAQSAKTGDKSTNVTTRGFRELREIKSRIPAVTHVDYTARIQTVSQNTNPIFYALIDTFFKLTGVPVLVNTSFNVRGEPIVESPKDAFRCFMGTKLDLLIVNNCILWKRDQKKVSESIYHTQYELD
jgi:carbamoyltransferase